MKTLAKNPFVSRRRLGPSAVAGLALAVLSGCVGYVGPSGVVYGAPPPLRAEVVGVAPGPGYVWTRGYWGRRGGRYVWTSGRWRQPPHEGAAWVDGHWEHRGSGYVFVGGYWR
jgi:WXXGXW repeat (2 copies)